MNTAPQSAPIQGGSGAMFDRIARRYDRLNRLISLGMDRGWRRRMVQSLECKPGDHILDVATGTADVALAITRSCPGTFVTGLDPSQGMLNVALEKAQKHGAPIRLIVGDAKELPFPDKTFAGTCIAFGIRNVPDRLEAIREMTRVTVPGGYISVLELSEPTHPLARIHVHCVVPWLGAWLSGEKEYRYLQTSIAAFPPPAEFAALMEAAGLQVIEIQKMALGAAHLYVGQRPE